MRNQILEEIRFDHVIEDALNAMPTDARPWGTSLTVPVEPDLMEKWVMPLTAAASRALQYRLKVVSSVSPAAYHGTIPDIQLAIVAGVPSPHALHFHHQDDTLTATILKNKQPVESFPVPLEERLYEGVTAALDQFLYLVATEWRTANERSGRTGVDSQ